jgi:hypothetical protein
MFHYLAFKSLKLNLLIIINVLDCILGKMMNGSNVSEGELVNIHDIEYGLRMTIFMGLLDSQNTYFHENAFKGAVVLIYNQNALDLDKEGILIKPGKYVNIILTKTISVNLPLPYNNCFDADQVKSVIGLEMARIGVAYTRSNCMTFCRQKIVIDRLSCYDVRYPRIFNASPCQDRETFEKLKNLIIDDNECQQFCPFECATTTYNWIISYGRFPSYYSYLELISTYPDQFLDIFGSNDETYSFEMIEKTMGRFFIYFDPLSIFEISQTPSIQVVDLIANVGGTFGLFIGLSMLSFVELFELIYFSMLALFQSVMKRKIQPK